MKIFTIYDSKAEAYLQPFFSPNKATATRQFQQAAQDETTEFHRHAGDYTLFQIGEWDEQAGAIKPDEAKMNLGLALDYLGDITDGRQTQPKLELAKKDSA